MRQTVYTRVSKSLGWESTTKVPIPSLAEAEDLKRRVEVDKCRNAFYSVFKVNRFCGSPETGEDQAALEVIGEAFISGSNLFKNVYDDED